MLSIKFWLMAVDCCKINAWSLSEFWCFLFFSHPPLDHKFPMGWRPRDKHLSWSCCGRGFWYHSLSMVVFLCKIPRKPTPSTEKQPHTWVVQRCYIVGLRHDWSLQQSSPCTVCGRSVPSGEKCLLCCPSWHQAFLQKSPPHRVVLTLAGLSWSLFGNHWTLLQILDHSIDGLTLRKNWNNQETSWVFSFLLKLLLKTGPPAVISPSDWSKSTPQHIYIKTTSSLHHQTYSL